MLALARVVTVMREPTVAHLKCRVVGNGVVLAVMVAQSFVQNHAPSSAFDLVGMVWFAAMVFVLESKSSANLAGVQMANAVCATDLSGSIVILVGIQMANAV